jgi:hypothetical protein
MNADGSGKRRLAPAATGGPSWSPDGRWLAFAGPDCHGTLDVLKVPATMAGAPVSLLPTSPCAGKPAAVDGYGGGGQVYSGFGVLPAWHPGGDLVHSIVMHEHRPGFMGYRPKGERVVAFRFANTRLRESIATRM